MMRLNDATPADWDRLRRKNPAIEKANSKADAIFNKWIDPAMREAHEILIEEGCTRDLDWGSSATLPTDAAERKAIPVYTGFISYFPLAIAAIAKVSLKGGIQHGQTADTLHWDRSKSGDEKDALMRHILDGDWEQVAWRAMANLEKSLEENT